MNSEEKKNAPAPSDKTSYRFVLVVAGVLIVAFFITVMIINSKKPSHLTFENLDKKVKGAHFIKTNQALLKQMQENWLPNDYFWPTALLDNAPNFQIGVLEVVRYNVRVLRDNLSRMRTTDRLDPMAEAAFTALSNDPYKWWFPSAESKWKQGFQNLDSFYQSLAAGRSRFFPRADNLVELLSQYVSLMGGVNTRLINAPRDIGEAISLEGDKMGESGPGTVAVEIPWSQIDDNFYYAQGVAYALYESFRAIESDFEQVLRDKNSIPLVRKILELLSRCEFEPLFIFNGDPDSIFANHSLNVSGVFNDARQKMNSLIIALMQG
ncbi:MAG: DUF2333 family protein [Desulfobacteraceae bacterium]|nr:MAG: DUF2333 family protein [Desulfobacteraceae bacterium]